MYILGINAYHGDASAAILHDGHLVAAVEEERFNRVKHSAGFPANAVRYCLQAAGIRPDQLDHIAIARDPKAHLLRKTFYAMRLPRMTRDRLVALGRFAEIKGDLAQACDVDRKQIRAQVHRVEHHKAHLASSFFVSGWDQAALLSVDGMGDFASTMWGFGEDRQIGSDGIIAFPHSLGLYYTAITQYLGFPHYGDEYKVMGLAAYGQPEYRDEFRKIVHLNETSGFHLGLEYFVHHTEGTEMSWKAGVPVVGNLYSRWLEQRLGPARRPQADIEKRHEDLAASLQARLEEAMFWLLNRLYKKTKAKTLCLAGGVAFNCVANGKIFAETPFEKIYIPPAPGDAGLSIGAAYFLYHQVLKQPRAFVMDHAYWGPEFGDHEIHRELQARHGEMSRSGGVLRKLDTEADMCQWVARRVAEGQIIGLFQGRMEFGPRALGNRSMIADPRRAEMKELLNRRIKHREPFRPFAPSILEEATSRYFEQSHPSPFMLMAYNVQKDKIGKIPAPTHHDGSGRLQTVNQGTNPRYWGIIKAFEQITGVPVLLNTSFNENEPIVCRPEEAIDCFLRTPMDAVIIGNYLVEKTSAQAPQTVVSGCVSR
ncbi:MAG: carbamoyltransferase [Acidobacteria bacterium]|nr:carbamoyltransferase [Acidobacteriota bacterium]MBI3657918.1 carbamoyltransferase [Acidobacteriota bacterium]